MVLVCVVLPVKIVDLSCHSISRKSSTIVDLSRVLSLLFFGLDLHHIATAARRTYGVVAVL